MQINYKETAEFLKANDNFYILCHGSPDGDTTGSGFGLCYALRKIGKKEIGRASCRERESSHV